MLKVEAFLPILLQSLHVGVELEGKTFVEEMISIFGSVVGKQRHAVDTTSAKNDHGFLLISDDVA